MTHGAKIYMWIGFQQKDGLGNAMKVTDFLAALPSLANWAGLYRFTLLINSSTMYAYCYFFCIL